MIWALFDSVVLTLTLLPFYPSFPTTNPLLSHQSGLKDTLEKTKPKRSSRKDAETSKSKSPPNSGRSKASALSNSGSGGSGSISGSGSGIDGRKLSTGEKTPGDWLKTDLASLESGEDWRSPKSKRSNRSGIPAAMSDDGGPEARSRSKRKKTSGVPPLATNPSRSRSSVHGEAGARLIAEAAQLSNNKCSADWGDAAGSSGEEEFALDDIQMADESSRAFLMAADARANATEGNESTSDRSPIMSSAHHSARNLSTNTRSGNQTTQGAVGTSGSSAFSSFDREALSRAPTQVPIAAYSRLSVQLSPLVPIAKPASRAIPASHFDLLDQIKDLESNVRYEFASLSGRQFSTLLELIGRMKTTLEPPQVDTPAPLSKGVRSHSSFTPFAAPSVAPVSSVPSIAVHSPIVSNNATTLATTVNSAVGTTVIITSSNSGTPSAFSSHITPNSHMNPILVPSASSPSTSISHESANATSNTSQSKGSSNPQIVTFIPPQVSGKPYLRLGRQMQDAGMQTDPRAEPQPLVVAPTASVPARYASRDDNRKGGKRSSSEAKRGPASGNSRNSGRPTAKSQAPPTEVVSIVSNSRLSKNPRSGSSGTLGVRTASEIETELNSGVDIYKLPFLPERSASSSAFITHSVSSHSPFIRHSNASTGAPSDSFTTAHASSSALALVAESGSNSSTGSLGVGLPGLSLTKLDTVAQAIDTSSQDSSTSSAGSANLPVRGPSLGNVTWHSHFDLLRSLDESEEELRRDTKGLAVSPSAALMMGGAPISRLAPPNHHLATAAFRMMQSEGNRSTESPDTPAKDVEEDPALVGGSPADSSMTPSPRRSWVTASKRSSSAVVASEIHSVSSDLRLGSRFASHTMPMNRGHSRNSIEDANRSEAEESSESLHSQQSTPIRDQGPVISLSITSSRSSPPPATETEVQVPLTIRATVTTTTATAPLPSPTSRPFINHVYDHSAAGAAAAQNNASGSGSNVAGAGSNNGSSRTMDSDSSFSSKSDQRKKKKKKGSSSSSSSSEHQPKAQQPLLFSTRSAFAPKRTSDPA